MPVKIVLDSEIGNNIDDAFSLALAAVSPEIEILGITTTQLKAKDRAIVADRLLKGYGCSIPICPGYNLAYWHQPSFDLRRLRKTNSRREQSMPEASRWLVDLLQSNSNITYVANASLTNLAAVLKKEPKSARSIDRIVMMGGWVSTAIPESNIIDDPEAMEIVVHSGIPIVAMGYEVTLGCVFPAQWIQLLRDSLLRGTNILATMIDYWSNATGAQEIILHDPLTIAWLCRPEIFQLKKVKVSLKTSGPAKGSLYADSVNGVEISIAAGCAKCDYLSFVLERLTGCRLGRLNRKIDNLGDTELEVIQAAEWRLPSGYTYAGMLDTRSRIIQVLSGSVFLDDEQSNSHLAGIGSIICLSSDFKGRILSEKGAVIRFVDFSDKGGQSLNELSDILPKYIEGPVNTQIGMYMTQIVEAWKGFGPIAQMSGRGALWSLLASLSQIREDTEANIAITHQADQIRQSKDMINQHFGNGLNVDVLSETLGMSKYQYIRAFKRYENATPAKYCLMKRIERARILLETTDMSVNDIAQSVGYTTAAAFTRAFTKQTGFTPTVYRVAALCSSGQNAGYFEEKVKNVSG